MKKIIITLIMALSLTGASAQVGTDFGVNMFMSWGGGVTMYHHMDQTVGPGFSTGAAIGKWILSPLALRGSFNFMTAPAIGDTTGMHFEPFASAGVEFMWDVNSTFFRIRNWRINAYPMIGLGLFFRGSYSDGIQSYRTDHAIHAMFGLHVPFRLSETFDLFLEYKGYLLDDGFDGGGETGVRMHSLTSGFNLRFFNSPFNRRTEFESRNPLEDWFIGFGIGPNYSSFDLFSNPNHGGLKMLGVAPEVMFGRNFSNFWSIRFELTGLTAHEIYDTVAEEAGDAYTFSMLHADLMVNLTHVLDFKRGVKWNVLPYLGAGAIWRYGNVNYKMSGDCGVMVRRYIDQMGDFYVDLKYIFVHPSISGGTGPSGIYYGVGFPSLTFGYIHNFGTSSARYRLPVGSTGNCAY